MTIPPPPPAMPPMPPAMPPVGGAMPEHGPYTFVEAIKVCFSKYVDFKGRARRSEFWYWQLFGLLVSFVVSAPTGFGNSGQSNGLGGIASLVSLALMLPTLAAVVRRLHDTGRSGLWVLLPIVGIIGLVVSGAGSFLFGLGAAVGGDAQMASDAKSWVIGLAVSGIFTFASYILLIVWLASDGGPNTPNKYGVRS